MASPAFGKHDLTPSSKTSNFQSKKKRFRPSEEAEAVESGDDYCIIDISDGNVEISESTATGENAASSAVHMHVSLSEADPAGSESRTLSVSSSSSSSVFADTRKSLDFSGSGIKKRQNDIRTVLLKTFVQCEGNEVDYGVMENVLKEEGLWCPSRSVIPCVKKTFDGCTYVKASKKFIGIKRKEPCADETHDCSPGLALQSESNIREGQQTESDQEFEDKVAQLLRKQNKTVENMVTFFYHLEIAEDEGGEQKRDEIKFLIDQVQEQLDRTTTSLVRLYQNKLVELQMACAFQPQQRTTRTIPDYLSQEMKERLVIEIKSMEAEFSFGLKEKPDRIVPDTTFENLVKHMKEHCYLLTEIFETLIMGDKPEGYFSQRVHRDLTFRLKGAVQALACLLNIGNQETTSDMPIIFGLVAISYGAGQKFVTLLNQFGITKSWKTL